jgi:polyisoprenyl-phosphate glycosyltransferase
VVLLGTSQGRRAAVRGPFAGQGAAGLGNGANRAMALATMVRERPEICLVIPVLNEAAGLEALVAALRQHLDGHDFAWSVLFVDDGSIDETLQHIRALNAADPRFSAISFSRNFGKEIAIAAGLRHAKGDAVVILDADLQHPPDMVPAFVAEWRKGAKIVFGQRQSRESDSWARRLYSRLFHFVFRHIAQTRLPLGVVDFLLMDRQAVDAINQLGERTRFSKGLYAWIGFASAVVPFESPDRFIGKSRWSFMKLASFALDGFVSFSSLPLKVWSYLGALVSLAAIAYGIYFLVRSLLFGVDVPGFPSLIVSIMFFAGVQLISLGIIGEYMARIYEEVKARPLYVVAEEIGTGKTASEPGRPA